MKLNFKDVIIPLLFFITWVPALILYSIGGTYGKYADFMHTLVGVLFAAPFLTLFLSMIIFAIVRLIKNPKK